MDKSYVVDVIVGTYEQTGKLVTRRILEENGHKELVKWVYSNYDNLLDFALQNGISDKVSASSGWTTTMLEREINNLLAQVEARPITMMDVLQYDTHLFFHMNRLYKKSRDWLELLFERFGVLDGVFDISDMELAEQEYKYHNHSRYYQRKPPGYYKNKIIHELNRAWALGYPINSAYVQRNFKGLYVRARHQFGSWKNAVEAAGFDYNEIMVNPLRGKQYYIDYLRNIYNEKGRISWRDLRNTSGSQRYFKSYREWFKAAGVPYSESDISFFKQWSKFGLRFERIVKQVFGILYPQYIYQFNGIDGIRPDWYDPETNTCYDAKLSLSTVDDWPELDTYLNQFDKIVVVYLRDNIHDYKHEEVELVHISQYVQMLPDDKRTKIESLLDKLKYDVNHAWVADECIEVWERHRGKIPDGFRIHHIDGDMYNNDISNLELVDEHTFELYRKGCYKNEQGAWVKRCAHCGEVKTLEDGYYRTKRGDLSWCKDCQRHVHNEWKKRKTSA